MPAPLQCETFGQAFGGVGRPAPSAGGIQGSYHLYARGITGVQAMNDPIVDEVRRVRDAHAARFNYDLDAIFQDIKEREKQSGLKFIEGVARQPVPNQTQQM